MAGTSVERPAASATGSLETRPLVHLLVYARNHRLTGQLELHAPDGRGGSLSLWRGRIHDARTEPAVAYFGSVAYELGLIDTPTMDATLLEISRSKRLHGEVLVERGALTPAQRDQVLVEQMCRKARFFFALPPEASFAFYTGEPSATEPPFLLDPIRAAWIGLVADPPRASVRTVVSRFASLTLRVVHEGAIASAGLDADETALCEALAVNPMNLAQLAAATRLSQERLELLVYLMVIAKCVEPVPVSSSSVSSPSSATIRAASVRTDAPVRSSLSFRVPSTPAMKAASGSSPRVAAIPSTLLSPSEVGATGIAHRARTIATDDPLTVLGLPAGAPPEAARAAYFRLSKLWHPDRLPPDLAMFRDEVEIIFDHLTRAHQALTDPDARTPSPAGGVQVAQPRSREESVREIRQALGRHDFAMAEELARHLASQNKDDAEALALSAWAAASAGDAPEATLQTNLLALDRAVQHDRYCAVAYYFRGMIYKRLHNNVAAFRDLARAAQLDPKNVDAQREVRVFEMRARKGSGEQALDALVIAQAKRK